MFRLRLAILGAAAVLALGTASAFAMTELTAGGNSDSHGDAVASAARNCPHGAGGVHGACVSSVARTNGESQDQGQGQPAKVKACKDEIRTSDKPGHRGIGVCVSGRSSGGTTSGSTSGSDESSATSDSTDTTDLVTVTES